jgi:hypothetical protein
MRVAIRSVGVGLISIVTAMLLALTMATPALAANRALMIGGLTLGTLPDLIMANIAGGKYKTENGYVRQNVVWPAEAGPYTGIGDMTLGQSIAQGTPALADAITTAIRNGDNVTVVGMSAGSLVVDEVLRQLAADPAAPGKGSLTFVVMADSSRQSTITKPQSSGTLGYTFRPPPVTKYNIDVVVKEYDGNADFPDRWWNLTAVLNAYAGSLLLHDSTFLTDYTKVPDSNIVKTTNILGGVTTTYLIPTENLPLVTLFPGLKSMQDKLRATIDRGYSRNDDLNTAAVTTLADTTEVADQAGQELADSNGVPAKVNAAKEELPTAAKVPAKVVTKTKKGAELAADEVVGNEAVTNGATNLVDGNKVTPSSNAGTTPSTKKAWKPGDGTLKRVIEKLFAKTPKVATTTGSSTGDPSTAKDSVTSSAT